MRCTVHLIEDDVAAAGVVQQEPDRQIETSIDDVISAVNVNRIAGDKPGRVMSQERCCSADVFDAH